MTADRAGSLPKRSAALEWTRCDRPAGPEFSLSHDACGLLQVQQAVGGYCLTDSVTEGCPIACCGPTLSAMTAYPTEQLQGSCWLSLAGVDSSGSALKALATAQRLGRAGSATLLLYTASGVPFWARVLVLPVKADPALSTPPQPQPGATAGQCVEACCRVRSISGRRAAGKRIKTDAVPLLQ